MVSFEFGAVASSIPGEGVYGLFGTMALCCFADLGASVPVGFFDFARDKLGPPGSAASIYQITKADL